MTEEEPRYTKPEDFFDEVTRDINISTESKIDEEPQTSVFIQASPPMPQLDITELPTQIGISIVDQHLPVADQPLKVEQRLPVPAASAKPQLPSEEKTPIPEFITSSKISKIPESSAPKPFPDFDFEDELKPPPKMTALANEFELGELWRTRRNTILITAMLIVAGVTLMISRSHRKSSDSVDVVNTESSAGPWSINLDRPMVEFHSETKNWSDLESQFDSAIQELKNQK